MFMRISRFMKHLTFVFAKCFYLAFTVTRFIVWDRFDFEVCQHILCALSIMQIEVEIYVCMFGTIWKCKYILLSMLLFIQRFDWVNAIHTNTQSLLLLTCFQVVYRTHFHHAYVYSFVGWFLWPLQKQIWIFTIVSCQRLLFHCQRTIKLKSEELQEKTTVFVIS